MRIGVYPGTFDPVTNGHLDIIARAAALVDRLVIAVAENSAKSPLLSLDDRVACVEQELPRIMARSGAEVQVVGFSCLLVEFMREHKAQIIIRGLRGLSDYDYEVQMSGLNRRLAPDVETVFLMASEQNLYTSSSMIKEVARLGGDVSGFIPKPALDKILAYYRNPMKG